MSKESTNQVSIDDHGSQLPGRWFSERSAALGATILLLAIILARSPFRAMPDSLFVSDGFGYYIYLPSLVLDGDTDLANQLAHQPGQPNQQWYAYVESTGRPGNCFQAGCAILWSPFFLLAHATILILNQFGWEIRTDGFGFPYELPVYLGSFVYGILGIWFTSRLLRDHFRPTVATAAVFYTTCATALAAYLWLEPDMSHVPSMFLISALFYLLHSIERRGSLIPLHWSLVGCLIGLIVAVRATDVIVVVAAIGAGGLVWWRDVCRWKSAILCVLVCGGAAFLCFLPQMLVWKELYGGYLTRPPAVYESLNWSRPDLAGLFFSLRRGILIWTPMLGVSLVGCGRILITGTRFARLSILVLLLALYFNATIPKWWVGASFSERRLVDYSVLFAWGLASSIDWFRLTISTKAIHWVGMCLCAYNWILMLRYFTHDLPEYGAISAYDLIVKTLTFPVQVVLRILN